MLNIEVPAVVRLASKCARVFFQLVDLQKINLFQSNVTEGSSRVILEMAQTSEAKVIEMKQVDFLEEAFKVIGAKIQI